MRQSLQFRLSLWLSLVILVVALVAGALSFAQAFREAIESQDGQLGQIAALLERQRLAPVPALTVGKPPDDDADARIVVQALRPSVASASMPQSELHGLSAELPDGLQTVRTANDSWRVFVKTLPSGERLAVGQRTEFRDHLASASAWQAVVPLLLLIPILLLLVGLLVRGALKPLKTRAAEIDARAEQDSSPVTSDDLPAEIRPFVVAINRLLLRVAQSIQAQQRFVVDAAHELRSPVAALMLQAERIESAATPLDVAERLSTLRAGLKRTQLLLNQLLSLARSQAPGTLARQQVSIEHVVRQVLGELMPLADAKHIDLGVQGDLEAGIMVSEVELGTLIKNLVENAIWYTPIGGRVDLSLHCDPAIAQEMTLRVEDTGPGIPEAERERVFDPFYRVPGGGAGGSGLGLSIVRVIAQRIGGQVSLGPSGIQGAAPGLRVSITFRGQRM